MSSGIRQAAAADRIVVGGDTLTVRAASDRSAGALLAVEVRMPAGGSDAAPARGRRALPSRVGRAGLLRGGRRRRGVAVGRGRRGVRRHTRRSRAHHPQRVAAEARAFVVFAPGSGMESFARAAGALGANWSPTVADVLALASAHGIEMTRALREVA